MVKFMNIKGQLSTVLDMKETQAIILALEDLEYFQMKMKMSGTEEQSILREVLKQGPSHGLTNRNT